LIVDRLPGLVSRELAAIGCATSVETGLKDAALGARLAALGVEVLVVRSTTVGAEEISAAKNLALLVRAGAGVNTIDVAAASARGVFVANCPGKNACAVAELTIGHLINLDRRITDNVVALRERRWDKERMAKDARGLFGRTLAVLGCGSIGREVVSRAKALGMEVVVCSRSLSETEAETLGVRRATTAEEAVRQADAITVHLALTDETRGRFGKGFFDAVRQGAYFVNTSRAEVVDQTALRAAIDNKNLRVALDVFDGEPPGKQGPFTDSIVDHPSVYGTHHVGASTEQAEEAVGAEVVRIVSAFAAGRTIPNCVNLAAVTPATHVLVVRHADRVGVLAHVLDALRQAGHNVQTMENIVFEGAHAACARIAIDGRPSDTTLAAVQAHEAVFSVTASLTG